MTSEEISEEHKLEWIVNVFTQKLSRELASELAAAHFEAQVVNSYQTSTWRTEAHQDIR